MFIGSDLGPGMLDGMRKEMPERWFMEGVTEANVIGMAAGLAMEGYVPYVNTIATFITRRCYEQVAVDLCLHKSAGAADRQWRRAGLRAARPDPSRHRGHRDHACAAEHDGDGGVRRATRWRG